MMWGSWVRSQARLNVQPSLQAPASHLYCVASSLVHVMCALPSCLINGSRRHAQSMHCGKSGQGWQERVHEELGKAIQRHAACEAAIRAAQCLQCETVVEWASPVGQPAVLPRCYLCR